MNYYKSEPEDYTEYEVRTLIKKMLTLRNTEGKIDFVYNLILQIDPTLTNSEVVKFINQTDTYTK